ncbi:hypothetical protein BY996DRAFT_6510441 [Phakopsora pachyrhizi]|nr:hypothetical protein BY996DRAFT_6510441 [Phakopsora pachyrhizi]
MIAKKIEVIEPQDFKLRLTPRDAQGVIGARPEERKAPKDRERDRDNQPRGVGHQSWVTEESRSGCQGNAGRMKEDSSCGLEEEAKGGQKGQYKDLQGFAQTIPTEVRTTEELLTGRMDQLARKKEVLELKYRRMMEVRAKLVRYWDSRMAHRLREPLVPGDMVLAYNKSMEDQWGKLAVEQASGNSYELEELDGIQMARRFTAAHIKRFYSQQDRFLDQEEEEGVEENEWALGEMVQAGGCHFIHVVNPGGPFVGRPSWLVDQGTLCVPEKVEREEAVEERGDPLFCRHQNQTRQTRTGGGTPTLSGPEEVKELRAADLEEEEVDDLDQAAGLKWGQGQEETPKLGWVETAVGQIEGLQRKAGNGGGGASRRTSLKKEGQAWSSSIGQLLTFSAHSLIAWKNQAQATGLAMSFGLACVLETPGQMGEKEGWISAKSLHPEGSTATERCCALQARFGTRHSNLSPGTIKNFLQIVSLEANNIQEVYIPTALDLKGLSTKQYAKTKVKWMKLMRSAPLDSYLTLSWTLSYQGTIRSSIELDQVMSDVKDLEDFYKNSILGSEEHSKEERVEWMNRPMMWWRQLNGDKLWELSLPRTPLEEGWLAGFEVCGTRLKPSTGQKKEKVGGRRGHTNTLGLLPITLIAGNIMARSGPRVGALNIVLERSGGQGGWWLVAGCWAETDGWLMAEAGGVASGGQMADGGGEAEEEGEWKEGEAASPAAREVDAANDRGGGGHLQVGPGFRRWEPGNQVTGLGRVIPELKNLVRFLMAALEVGEKWGFSNFLGRNHLEETSIGKTMQGVLDWRSAGLLEDRRHKEDGYGWSRGMAWKGGRWQWCKKELEWEEKGGAESAPGILQGFEEEGVVVEENGWCHWKEGQKLGGGAHKGQSGWSKTTGATDL